ncbi:MAG: hypothetical protein HOL85_10480 [Rhodospirillaceae bacterium]|jgi:hypothetical protein|nr:hypothetical protein [Rhodospirillaceae bacterium]MBT6138525.1 hypothetical protein [Rhodospirillaceae bacterium]
MTPADRASETETNSSGTADRSERMQALQAQARAEAAAAESAPHENEPSPLDPQTHSELVEMYRSAGENLRFAKGQQWRMLIYFTVICAAVVTVSVVLRWGDRTLIAFFFYLTWFFSFATIITLAVLQSWQAGEQRKIAFILHKFSSTARAAERMKSRLSGDIHRYLLLAVMMLYVELATFAVSRMMWPRF